MRRIFWRSKENILPPPNAQFVLQPFSGLPTSFSPEVILELPNPMNTTVIHRIDIPSRQDWITAVEKALAQIELGQIQKVVLARKTVLHLSSRPDPFRIAAALEKKAQGAALYCLEFEQSAFLGASPERLFQRKGRQIVFDAIAGTRRLSLGQELLASEKDRREFQFVQDYFRETLRPCSEHLSFKPIGLHRTSNLHHLFSQGTAHLLPNITDQELLKRLHPTPALCGTPKNKAFEWIAKEPFTRNLYGGVIGWSTPQESDWTVAIRCCHLEGSKATIYTGTGIVAGSDPEAEWDELEAKLALYEEIFSCGR